MLVLRLHKLRTTGLDKNICADLRQLPRETGSESGRRFINFAALISTLMPNPPGINAAARCEGWARGQSLTSNGAITFFKGSCILPTAVHLQQAVCLHYNMQSRSQLPDKLTSHLLTDKITSFYCTLWTLALSNGGIARLYFKILYIHVKKPT